MTGPQAQGAFWATLLFAIPGLVLGGGVGWYGRRRQTPMFGWWAPVVLVALLGALCGGTIGFLLGGGLAPRFDALDDPGSPMDDPRLAAERDVLVAVHANERDLVEGAASVLSAMGAERVDLVDRRGIPLPPQADHPRPADPEGWWWRRAGHG